MGKMPKNSLGKFSELKLHCFCLFDTYSMPKNMYSAQDSKIQTDIKFYFNWRYVSSSCLIFINLYLQLVKGFRIGIFATIVTILKLHNYKLFADASHQRVFLVGFKIPIIGFQRVQKVFFLPFLVHRIKNNVF